MSPSHISFTADGYPVCTRTESGSGSGEIRTKYGREGDAGLTPRNPDCDMRFPNGIEVGVIVPDKDSASEPFVYYDCPYCDDSVETIDIGYIPETHALLLRDPYIDSVGNADRGDTNARIIIKLGAVESLFGESFPPDVE